MEFPNSGEKKKSRLYFKSVSERFCAIRNNHVVEYFFLSFIKVLFFSPYIKILTWKNILLVKILV